MITDEHRKRGNKARAEGSKTRTGKVSELDRYSSPQNDYTKHRQAKVKCGYCGRAFFCNRTPELCQEKPVINRISDNLESIAWLRPAISGEGMPGARTMAVDTAYVSMENL